VLPGRKKSKSIAVSQISSKAGRDVINKGTTVLYCLFIAADCTVDAISLIRRIVLRSKNKFFLNPDPAQAGFEFINPARI